jgi:hypothetical protein
MESSGIAWEAFEKIRGEIVRAIKKHPCGCLSAAYVLRQDQINTTESIACRRRREAGAPGPRSRAGGGSESEAGSASCSWPGGSRKGRILRERRYGVNAHRQPYPSASEKVDGTYAEACTLSNPSKDKSSAIPMMIERRADVLHLYTHTELIQPRVRNFRTAIVGTGNLAGNRCGRVGIIT